MNDPFKDTKAELISAAKIAQSGPEHDGFWDQLAEFFDRRRESAEILVTPRKTSGP